jgi:hypothetical protein
MPVAPPAAAPPRQTANFPSQTVRLTGSPPPTSATPLRKTLADSLRGLKVRGEYSPDLWSAGRQPDERIKNSLDQGGDDSASAAEILGIPFVATGTTVGYHNDYDVACPYTGSTAPDVVYHFAPILSEYVTISVCGANFDTKLYIYDTVCSGVPVACNDDACQMSSGLPFASRIDNFLLLAGHHYYIVVDGFGREAGTYSLSLSAASHQCIVSPIFSTPAYGFQRWEAGDQILVWIHPECDFAEQLSLDSVTFRFADASAFGEDGGDGILEYRVNICAALEHNPCTGPAQWLYTSTPRYWVTDGHQGIVSHSIDGDVCLDGGFFVALELVSWTGQPDRVPSPLWDSYTPAPCQQWICHKNCVDFVHRFDFNAAGNLDVTAYLKPGACPVTPVPIACAVACAPSVRESVEPECGDDFEDVFNGGCDMTPLQFESLDCGDTLCAAAGSFMVNGSPYGDSDWYELTVADSAEIYWAVAAPFTVIARVYSALAGCHSTPLAASVPPGPGFRPCDTLRLTTVIPPGSYWLEVYPYLWDYLDCSSRYLVWTSCRPTAVCNPADLCCTPAEFEPNDRCPESVDPFVLLDETTLCGSICPAGDVDLFAWSIPAGFRSTVSDFSGDSCRMQPARVRLALLDTADCADASGGQPPSSTSWTLLGPARHLLRVSGATSLAQSPYRLTLSSENIGICSAVCLGAPPLPPDTTLQLNTCSGCVLYPGTFEDSCRGPQWISGLQSFFTVDVPEPALYCFTLSGDSAAGPCGQDVQFRLFTDCRHPDSSCVLSQDRNYPGSEITAPAHVETCCAFLTAGRYFLSASSYDIFENGLSCAPMTVRMHYLCNPVQDLTCAFIGDPARTVLRWTVPQPGMYRVWSTTYRNNDGDPDNGSDPQWTLQAVLTLPQGAASWTDPQPVRDYMTYAVVHSCP